MVAKNALLEPLARLHLTIYGISRIGRTIDPLLRIYPVAGYAQTRIHGRVNWLHFTRVFIHFRISPRPHPSARSRPPSPFAEPSRHFVRFRLLRFTGLRFHPVVAH